MELAQAKPNSRDSEGLYGSRIPLEHRKLMQKDDGWKWSYLIRKLTMWAQ